MSRTASGNTLLLIFSFAASLSSASPGRRHDGEQPVLSGEVPAKSPWKWQQLFSHPGGAQPPSGPPRLPVPRPARPRGCARGVGFEPLHEAGHGSARSRTQGCLQEPTASPRSVKQETNPERCSQKITQDRGKGCWRDPGPVSGREMTTQQRLTETR